MTPSEIAETLIKRLRAKSEVAANGCWLWTAAINDSGYGIIRVGPVTKRAHRVAYELLVGPIPKGLQIDHLCRVRHCINPDHMEPVTPRENLRRGDTLNARHAAKTHCPQGHAYDEANTYRFRGHRQCRACWPAHNAKARLRRKEGLTNVTERNC